tara:strand:- start:1282 stop:2562 length:1281 start_codon:yes stop_codon:yes gene_type:complete
MAYIGVSPSNGVRRVHTYTATASQTTFSGAGAEGTSLSYKDSNFVDVYQNGVKLGDADYTATSGTSIVLGTGASASDLVVIVVFDVFSVADTVSKADGGTFDGNVTMAGTLGVTGNQTNSGNLTVSGAFTSQGIDDNADATAITIDSSENVGVGTTSPSQKLDIVGSSANIRVAESSGGDLRMNVSGSTGGIGTHSNHDLLFRTNSSERMRIDSAGRVLVGKTSANSTLAGVNFETGGSGFVTTNVHCAFFNRQNDDGNLIVLVQQNITEGTISVSGSTVSYNGGHLSRWSRLLNNTKDETIVKGTVMTNLDEMVEWGDEDNEQLNKMAVSSVEGDANVAGVFVNWDNDDDWNDMNVAMTGDMVIRIAKGTTVARGDLLMSAGDGTAKPQDDDIVRSKTIAKVTSTNVSHTYDDGTYLVPCVLMAC